MRLLPVAAAVATIAHGMLIPPAITTADVAQLRDLAPHPAALIVDCKDCPVDLADLGEGAHQEEKSSRLVFSLMADNYGPEERLWLNDLRLWPLAMGFESGGALTVPQMVKVNDNWAHSGQPKASYRMSYDLDTVLADGKQRLILRIQILGLNNELIKSENVPTIEIDAIKTSDNRLSVKSMTLVDAVTTKTEVPCTDTLCRLHAAMKKALGKPAGCHGRKNPQHFNPAPGSHHGHHVSPMMHRLRSLTLHVLLPASVGIMAGIAASIVGMIAGHLMICIYRLCRGRNARNGNDGDEDEGEKVLESWAVYQDGPPRYAEVPVEGTQEVFADEKAVLMVAKSMEL